MLWHEFLRADSDYWGPGGSVPRGHVSAWMCNDGLALTAFGNQITHRTVKLPLKLRCLVCLWIGACVTVQSPVQS